MLQERSEQDAARAGAGTLAADLAGALKWRPIGPHRGGRVVAVAGDPRDRLTFYFGSTGGGVWKTIDGGARWENCSDGYFGTASVGALAVADADPNVIYAGMGETTIRGNVSHGDGVYKSVDGGKGWVHCGLAETRNIARVRVHPTDPDLVYVAAFGHVYGPNPERGLYRSGDGGRTWERVLFVSDRAGAIDLSIDPANPRVLYCAFWEAGRTPYSLSSGGPGSGLWKSTDGGDTWAEISRRPGLPEGVLGKIGVAVSPARPERVWALVEAADGALFRSDDGGERWTRLSDDREILQRAWYYSHVIADPRDPDTVWAPNVKNLKSHDGGKSFVAVPTPHGDNHDLWIDPRDPQRMIQGNDGGACVSFDGGRSWSTIYNQPTAEFYHVTTDTRTPYRVYGAQQDNTTLSVPSRSDYGAITWGECAPVGGGESGYIAVRPDNPDVVYAGSYGGLLTRFDARTRQARNIAVWPDNPMGWGAKDLKYRFQWTFPIVLSPHDPDILYVAGNCLFRSTDEGGSWEAISPDLTRADRTKMEPSGGPITKDSTSVEYYGTIFAFAESPLRQGVLWAGSDDGLIHLSRDGGRSWENVTPPTELLPEWALIAIIEPAPQDPAVAYVAATRYKSDDFTPYLLKTGDYGRTWTRITDGIPAHDFARVIRADPARPGLLYAGTEGGAWVSWNDGASWRPLGDGLPVVPVHDLAVRDGDLVAATHGRAFWILDDLTRLHQVTDEAEGAPARLFKPRPTVRYLTAARPPRLGPETPRGYGSVGGLAVNAYQRPGPDGGEALGFFDAGQNPPGGVVVTYYLARPPAEDQEVKLTFFDARGGRIKEFTSRKPEKGADDGHGAAAEPRVPAKVGVNTFVWNGRYPDARAVPGAVFWAGGVTGPLAPPGDYRVQLTVGDGAYTQGVRLVKDPRVAATQDDLERQFELLLRIRDRLSAAHDAVNQARGVRAQVEEWRERTQDRPDAARVTEAARGLIDRLNAVEEELIQHRSKAHEDPLNFPIKLNNKLAALAGVVASADAAPTRQSYAVFEDLSVRLDQGLARLREIVATDVAAFNALIREAEFPAIVPAVPAARGGSGG